MRQLHPVAYHEQFLARGTYIHEREGKPDGLIESWTIHRLPDHSHLIRVDWDERATVSGSTLLLEALRDPQGNIQRFDIHLYNPKGAVVQQAKASFIIYENRVQVARQINDQPRQQEEIALPASTIIVPPMHIFTGSVIQQIIAQSGKDAPVFTPNCVDLDTDIALSGIIDTYSASMLGTETITIAGKAISATEYRFFSRHDDEQSAFWLDQQVVLIMVQDRHERIILKNDARSNDFKQ